MKHVHVINQFNAGEFTPRMIGRTDIPRYQSSCQHLENFIPEPQGGARRRSGTKFVAKVKDSTKATRLINFEYSIAQSYVIEMGDEYMRFYTDGEQIQNIGVVSSASWTSTVVTAELNLIGPTAGSTTVYDTDSTEIKAKIVGDVTAFFPARSFVKDPTDSRWHEIENVTYDGTNTHIAFVKAAHSTFRNKLIKAYIPHKYIAGQDVTITNASPSGYNGTVTVDAIDKDEEIVEVGDSITFNTNGTITPSGSGYNPFLSVKTNDILIVTGAADLINNGTFTVASITDDTPAVPTVSEPLITHASGAESTINIVHRIPRPTTIEYSVASDPGTFVEGGDVTGIFEVVSPYKENELNNVKWTQSADILFMCHPDYQPRELRRYGETNWELVLFDFKDGPWERENTTDINLQPSNTSGDGRTIIVKAGATDTDLNIFSSTDVGRLVQIEHASGWGYAKITGFVSPSKVFVDIKEDFFNSTKKPDWRLGAWSDTTGWPWITAFHEGRLWFAGRHNAVQTIWSSSVNDFNNFQPYSSDETIADNDAITFTISDNQVNAIHWLKSVPQGLLVLTKSGEFIVSSNDSTKGLTPSSMSIIRHSSYGSDQYAPPVQVGSSVIFVQRGGRKVREASFSFQSDSFVSTDLTILADHVAESGFVSAAYTEEPHRAAWFATNDGALWGLTIQKDQEVIAWHRHPLGGTKEN